jgi:hypothetical protein
LDQISTAIKWVSFIVMLLAFGRIVLALLWGGPDSRGPVLERALLYLVVGAALAVVHFVRERRRRPGP